MAVDKRVAQSQKLITDALLRLMGQYKFREITVLQICQEADVSRNTFYRLYDSKEEVIQAYVGKVTAEIIGQFEKLENFDFIAPEREDIERTYNRFYTFWLKKKELLQILYRQNLLIMFYREFCVFAKNKMSDEVIRYYESRTNSVIGGYYYGWYGSATCSILESWAERNFKETPEQLTEITIQLYQSINYQFDV